MARNRTALQKYLAEQKMTQQTLANLVGESVPVVNAWVQGKSEPGNFAKLRKLHKVTGISYAELVGDRS